MDEKNKKNKQELDTKDELRRVVLEYIGEKDSIRRVENNKLLRKKELKFSKLEQIQTDPVKDAKNNEDENKINKEDIDNARKAILGCAQDKKKELVKKENKQDIAFESPKIEKIEVVKRDVRKKKKAEEKRKKKKNILEKKNTKKNVIFKLDGDKIKSKEKNISVINIFIIIAILFILLFVILIYGI
ncbi:MAG: hypothetical protein V1655_01005 [bacterium]